MATTTRKSRASRTAEADAIKAAEAGEIEPTTEAVEEAAEAAQQAGNQASEATRQADQQPEPEAGSPGPDSTGETGSPGTEPEPYALVDAESYEQTFYRPSVRVCVPGPDGESVEVIAMCDHDPSHGGNHWGHRDEKAALTCARRIAASRGLRIGAK